MDANGTHFHLLLGYDDWAASRDNQGRTLRETWESSPLEDDTSGLAWDHARFELTLQPRLFRFIAAPNDNPPTLENRRGAARDRYGNWYWISEDRREILANSAGTGTTSHFWSVGDGLRCEQKPRYGEFHAQASEPPPAPLGLNGLAVTEDHYLVAGVLDPAGLVIFDLHAGGPPQQIFWPAAVPFAPFDMAARPCGGVWILDRKHKRYWALDRHFNVIRQDQLEITLAPEQQDDFQPQDGSATRQKPAQTFPEGIVLEAASPLMALDPIAIEALPDETVLILDRNPDERFSLIYRCRYGALLGRPVSTRDMIEIVEDDVRSQFHLTAHDFAFVPEHEEAESRVEDRLYIVAADGNQTFAFFIAQQNDQLVLRPLAIFYPMRLFGGRALVAAGKKVYYDFSDRWVALVAQERPRYVSEATLTTSILNGREPDCVWHRLILEACLPPETEAQVWSRAANEKEELGSAAWQLEPRFYRRGDGSELPFARSTKNKGYEAWELLLQRARGRYAQLSGCAKTIWNILVMIVTKYSAGFRK